MVIGLIESEDEDLLQHLDHIVVSVVVIVQQDDAVQRNQFLPFQDFRIGRGGRLSHVIDSGKD